MDIEGFKKLVKKYEPLHAAFVNDAMTGERYYKNGSDILLAEKKRTGKAMPSAMQTTGYQGISTGF